MNKSISSLPSYGGRRCFLNLEKKNALVAGGLAGLVNGFLGGGGGMVLVPLLSEKCNLEQQKSFTTSIAIIFPISLISSIIYLLRGKLILKTAFPYLLGGLLGGFWGGRLFQKLNMRWLKKIFALFMLYGGVKALFFL